MEGEATETAGEAAGEADAKRQLQIDDVDKGNEKSDNDDDEDKEA